VDLGRRGRRFAPRKITCRDPNASAEVPFFAARVAPQRRTRARRSSGALMLRDVVIGSRIQRRDLLFSIVRAEEQ